MLPESTNVGSWRTRFCLANAAANSEVCIFNTHLLFFVGVKIHQTLSRCIVSDNTATFCFLHLVAVVSVHASWDLLPLITHPHISAELFCTHCAQSLTDTFFNFLFVFRFLRRLAHQIAWKMVVCHILRWHVFQTFLCCHVVVKGFRWTRWRCRFRVTTSTLSLELQFQWQALPRLVCAADAESFDVLSSLFVIVH